ncbi:MAG: mechanosensitive ion channel family protein [Pirellulaceae bacterium]
MRRFTRLFMTLALAGFCVTATHHAWADDPAVQDGEQDDQEKEDEAQDESVAELFSQLSMRVKAGEWTDVGNILWKLIVMGLVKFGQFASVFFGFWIMAAIVSKMIRRAGGLNAVDSELAAFMGRVAKTAMLVVGAICGVATMGVDVTALIAGLGLTGFALGFALKDVVSNVVAGVLILIYRPVRAGEHVKVKTFEGRILSTDLRYTVLQTDDQVIYVPNSIMFTDAITVDRTAETVGDESAVPGADAG